MRGYPKVLLYDIGICNACIYLEGDMCHTPGCVFVRLRMTEVKELLATLMLRDDDYGILPEPCPATKRL